jgi:hypothetical protein
VTLLDENTYPTGCDRSHQHDRQSPSVVLILQDDRLSAAALCVAVGGWQLHPMQVAAGHWSAVSHRSITAYASSLALSHWSNSACKASVTLLIQ